MATRSCEHWRKVVSGYSICGDEVFWSGLLGLEGGRDKGLNLCCIQIPISGLKALRRTTVLNSVSTKLIGVDSSRSIEQVGALHRIRKLMFHYPKENSHQLNSNAEYRIVLAALLLQYWIELG